MKTVTEIARLIATTYENGCRLLVCVLFLVVILSPALLAADSGLGFAPSTSLTTLDPYYKSCQLLFKPIALDGYSEPPLVASALCHQRFTVSGDNIELEVIPYENQDRKHHPNVEHLLIPAVFLWTPQSPKQFRDELYDYMVVQHHESKDAYLAEVRRLMFEWEMAHRHLEADKKGLSDAERETFITENLNFIMGHNAAEIAKLRGTLELFEAFGLEESDTVLSYYSDKRIYNEINAIITRLEEEGRKLQQRLPPPPSTPAPNGSIPGYLIYKGNEHSAMRWFNHRVGKAVSETSPLFQKLHPDIGALARDYANGTGQFADQGYHLRMSLLYYYSGVGVQVAEAAMLLYGSAVLSKVVTKGLEKYASTQAGKFITSRLFANGLPTAEKLFGAMLRGTAYSLAFQATGAQQFLSEGANHITEDYFGDTPLAHFLTGVGVNAAVAAFGGFGMNSLRMGFVNTLLGVAKGTVKVSTLMFAMATLETWAQSQENGEDFDLFSLDPFSYKNLRQFSGTSAGSAPIVVMAMLGSRTFNSGFGMGLDTQDVFSTLDNNFATFLRTGNWSALGLRTIAAIIDADGVLGASMGHSAELSALKQADPHFEAHVNEQRGISDQFVTTVARLASIGMEQARQLLDSTEGCARIRAAILDGVPIVPPPKPPSALNPMNWPTMIGNYINQRWGTPAEKPGTLLQFPGNPKPIPNSQVQSYAMAAGAEMQGPGGGDPRGPTGPTDGPTDSHDTTKGPRPLSERSGESVPADALPTYGDIEALLKDRQSLRAGVILMEHGINNFSLIKDDSGNDAIEFHPSEKNGLGRLAARLKKLILDGKPGRLVFSPNNVAGFQPNSNTIVMHPSFLDSILAAPGETNAYMEHEYTHALLTQVRYNSTRNSAASIIVRPSVSVDSLPLAPTYSKFASMEELVAIQSEYSPALVSVSDSIAHLSSQAAGADPVADVLAYLKLRAICHQYFLGEIDGKITPTEHYNQIANYVRQRIPQLIDSLSRASLEEITATGSQAKTKLLYAVLQDGHRIEIIPEVPWLPQRIYFKLVTEKDEWAFLIADGELRRELKNLASKNTGTITLEGSEVATSIREHLTTQLLELDTIAIQAQTHMDNMDALFRRLDALLIKTPVDHAQVSAVLAQLQDYVSSNIDIQPYLDMGPQDTAHETDTPPSPHDTQVIEPLDPPAKRDKGTAPETDTPPSPHDTQVIEPLDPPQAGRGIWDELRAALGSLTGLLTMSANEKPANRSEAPAHNRSGQSSEGSAAQAIVYEPMPSPIHGEHLETYKRYKGEKGYIQVARLQSGKTSGFKSGYETGSLWHIISLFPDFFADFGFSMVNGELHYPDYDELNHRLDKLDGTSKEVFMRYWDNRAGIVDEDKFTQKFTNKNRAETPYTTANNPDHYHELNLHWAYWVIQKHYLDYSRAGLRTVDAILHHPLFTPSKTPALHKVLADYRQTRIDTMDTLNAQIGWTIMAMENPYVDPKLLGGRWSIPENIDALKRGDKRAAIQYLTEILQSHINTSINVPIEIMRASGVPPTWYRFTTPEQLVAHLISLRKGLGLTDGQITALQNIAEESVLPDEPLIEIDFDADIDEILDRIGIER